MAAPISTVTVAPIPTPAPRSGGALPIQAAMRADTMLDKGDLNGYAVWRRILRAVGELQREIATAGDQIKKGNDGRRGMLKNG